MSKIIEILKNRNYTVVDENDQYILMKDTNHKNILIFNINSSLTINVIKIILKCMIDNNFDHSIVVYDGKITPSSNKIIKNTDLTIELFTHNEMSINIFNHKYYFPHIKVDETTKQLLLTKYGTKLPIILKSDPVIRYLNYKKGDIVKIIRKNNYITYRLVK